MKQRILSPKERFAAERDKARRMALKALRRARKAAEKSGVALSEWEGEFLGSVESRVVKYGRAFADPDKGGPGTSLSLRQAHKLKEIAGKAKAKSKAEAKEKDSAPRKKKSWGRLTNRATNKV